MPLIAVDARMINHSGIGTYIRQTLPCVVAVLDSFDFIILGDAKELRGLEWPGSAGNRLDFIHFDAPIYSLREHLAAFRRIPRRSDAFWSPHYPTPLLWRGLLAVTVHDCCHLALPGMYPGLLKRAYSRYMFSRVVKRADLVLCDSRFTRDELERLAGHPRGVCRVVHLGVSGDWFKVRAAASGRERPYLLYLGNVKPHKNLAKLLDAFEGCLESVDVDLVIVGRRRGFLTGDRLFVERARALGDRLRFTGWIPDRELKGWMSRALALVMPSLYEGFCLPIVEAMACRCPVVASRIPVVEEVYGDAVLYFDPEDPIDMTRKMRVIVEDGRLRGRLKESGLKKAGEYSWSDCAKRTALALRALVTGEDPGGEP